MRKRDIVLRLAVILALAAILLPLAAVFLISTAVLVIPAVPLVAVAVLASLLVLAARREHTWAAGPPQVDAQPHRCPLPLARARVSSRRT
jgi:peptidoglycan/LPS O-acetylase OafA/YrhL